jgi:hypothetical protein
MTRKPTRAQLRALDKIARYKLRCGDVRLTTLRALSRRAWVKVRACWTLPLKGWRVSITRAGRDVLRAHDEAQR